MGEGIDNFSFMADGVNFNRCLSFLVCNCQLLWFKHYGHQGRPVSAISFTQVVNIAAHFMMINVFNQSWSSCYFLRVWAKRMLCPATRKLLTRFVLLISRTSGPSSPTRWWTSSRTRSTRKTGTRLEASIQVCATFLAWPRCCRSFPPYLINHFSRLRIVKLLSKAVSFFLLPYLALTLVCR